MKSLRPKEKTELFEEDETEVLEKEDIPYMQTIATNTSESKIEVVAASHVTQIKPEKVIDDITANLKVDANYPLISDMQQVQEKEEPLELTHKTKVLIQPSLSEKEPLQITEIEVSGSVDEYQTTKIKSESKAKKSIVSTESIITSEIITNLSVSDLDKPSTHTQKAKPTMILKDAFGVSEQIVSSKEAPLEELSLKKSNAAVTFSPYTELSVSEVHEEIREQDVDTVIKDKFATSKLNFNLLESVQVGEVFIEDKSGKYYPELIVPTETARKDILLSNQLITAVHDVQEKEGALSDLKLPPAQEANVDITSKDSLVICIDETHEREGHLPAPEKPAAVTIGKDIILHTSLSNTITTSHIKESEFVPESITSKKAIIGINEHQHKFNLETDIHESENAFEKSKSIQGTHAEISISTLDKNIVEEVHVNESEKDLIIKEDKSAAHANLEVGSVEPIVTSETVQMTSTTELTLSDKALTESATQSFITENAKVVSYPLVHDQEVYEEYLSKKPENVTESLIPNISLTILQTESSESENKLNLNKIPEMISAKSLPTHPLKTPISEEVTTADQINYIDMPAKNTERASEQRDLYKEITVLETTVQEQLDKLDESRKCQSKAVTSFIGKESLNVTEVVSSVNEEKLEAPKPNSTIYAKVDIDADHKIALTSEVTTGDALNKFETLAPNYQEANINSNLMTSLLISENKALDTQTSLQNDIQPDFKSITPEIISTEETINVTEIMKHEKESDYNVELSPETITASADITGHPVAVLSEMIVDSSVGFTEDVNLKTKYKKANVENIAHKEIIITTAESNEKESSFDTSSKPTTVSALVNFDSSQAIIIEENKPEIAPSAFENPNEVLWAKAKEAPVSKEAITQQETFVHLSEGILIREKTENKTKPTVTLASLQAPVINEKLSIETETSLITPTVPDEQIADLTFTQQHGLVTSETLSQTDNLPSTDSLKMELKTASYKLDEIYGKTANVEEVITNQQTEEFSNDKISMLKSEVSSIPQNYTLEQTEIITAEKETILPQQKTFKSNVSPDFTETQAIITSCVEAIDKEKYFDEKLALPTQDASVGIVPLISSIDTEVLVTRSVTNLEEKSPVPSKATMMRDDLQKHLQGIEILVGEKESELNELKRDLQQEALPKLIELSAKEVSEVLPIENEKELKESASVSSSVAYPSINEQQSILNTEVIVSQESEVLHVSGTKVINAITTHGIQEAILKTEPFVGEVEDTFLEETTATKVSKGNVEEQKSVDVTEVILSEAEIPLLKILPTKTENIQSKFEESNYVNVSMVMTSDKEVEIKLESQDLPKEKPGIVIESHQHITITDTQTREKEESMQPTDTPHKTIKHIDIKPIHHITTTETVPIERGSEFSEEETTRRVNANEFHLMTEAINYETQQPMESIISLTADFKPEETQAYQDIIGLKSVEQTEVVAEESPKSFSKHLPKDEKAQRSQTTVKEIISMQPHLLEDAARLSTDYKPEKSKIEYELEVHKTYITSENSAQELTGIIIAQDSSTKLARQKLVEMESLQQTEVVVGEKFEKLQIFEGERSEKADESRITLQELSNIKPEIFEDIQHFTGSFKPETTKASVDIETHKSCIVTDDVTHESSKEIIVPDKQLRQVTEQILEMKPLQQTEVITEENAPSIKSSIQEEKTIFAKPIEIQPISQSDVIVHEKEVETSFERPTQTENALLTFNTTEGISVYQITYEDSEDNFFPHKDKHVTAEKTITPLSHVQCTENIAETQADDFITQPTPSKTTAITATEHSPIIVTDNISLQHENELHITEPKQQKLRQSLTIASEINVTEEFVREQILPYTEIKPELLKTKVTTTDETYHTVTLLEQDTQYINGKF